MNDIKLDKTEVFAGELEDLMEELRDHLGWILNRREEVDVEEWKVEVLITLNKIRNGADASIEEIKTHEKAY